MALARVQSSGKWTANSTTSIAFGMTPPTVGNGLLVLVWGWGFGATAPYLCVDNRGNAYGLGAIQTANGSTAAVFHCSKLTATGSPFTITLTANGGFYWRVVAVEVSGVNYGLLVNQVAATALFSTTTVSIGPAPPLTVADTFQVAVLAHGGSPSAIQVIADTPVWFEEAEQLAQSNGLNGESDSRVVTASLGTTPICIWESTGGNASFSTAVLVAYQAADAPIVIPPLTIPAVTPGVKVTAPTEGGFGIAGLTTFPGDAALVRVTPGLMAGALPGSLTSAAAVVKVTAPAAAYPPRVDALWGNAIVRVSAPAVTLAWKFLTPPSPKVRVRASIAAIWGGAPVAAGGEWRKPVAKDGHSLGQAFGGDSCRVYQPALSERAPGDLLILSLIWIGGTQPAPAVPGWTLIAEEGTSVVRVAMYWKRHASVEPSQFTLYGLGAATTYAETWVESYRGGLLGDPVLVFGTDVGVRPDTAPSLPSLPITEPYTLILGLIGAINTYYQSGFAANNYHHQHYTADPDLMQFRRRVGWQNSPLAWTLFDGLKLLPGHTGPFGWNGDMGPFAAVVVALRSGVVTPTPGRYYLAKKQATQSLIGPTIGDWVVGWIGSKYGFPLDRTWELSPLASESGGLVKDFVITNVYPPVDALFARWVTPPLAAQTLGGTLTFVAATRAGFDDSVSGQVAISARWRLHAYVTIGESTEVRATVIDRWMSGTDLPFLSGSPVPSSGPISLAAVTVQAGDRLLLEIGVRILSAPTPPVVREPNFDSAYIEFATGATGLYYYGEAYYYVPATVPWVDSVVGEEEYYSGAPWLQFSQPLVERAKPLPPPNDAVSRATVIPSLPFEVTLDTTQSTDPGRGVWFRYTPTVDETLLIHTFQSNYGLLFWAYQGASPEVLMDVTGRDPVTFEDFVKLEPSYGNAHSQTWGRLIVKAGQTYWLRFTNWTLWREVAPSSGGRFGLRISHYAPLPPQIDDLYLPSNGVIGIWRNGECVDLTDSWAFDQPTGIAIDYSRRPLTDLDDGVNTGERLYLGFHGYSLVEVTDLVDWETELNYLGDAWEPNNRHLCSLAMDASGRLLSGWFGYSYLWAEGTWAEGNQFQVFLNQVAFLDEAPVRRIDAVTGCDAPEYTGAEAETFQVPYEKTGSNYIAIADDQTTLYYTSSGFYVPVGGQIIHRFDLGTHLPLTDFATLPPHGLNPGLRGMCVLLDGGLLVCNGSQVDRLSAAGAVIQSYVPTAAVYPTTRHMLIDVHLTYDETRFWVLDNHTHDLFEFALTGAQLRHVQTGLIASAVTQFAIYAPPFVEPPEPPPPAVCPVDFLIDLGSDEDWPVDFPIDPMDGSPPVVPAPPPLIPAGTIMVGGWGNGPVTGAYFLSPDGATTYPQPLGWATDLVDISSFCRTSAHHIGVSGGNAPHFPETGSGLLKASDLSILSENVSDRSAGFCIGADALGNWYNFRVGFDTGFFTRFNQASEVTASWDIGLGGASGYQQSATWAMAVSDDGQTAYVWLQSNPFTADPDRLNFRIHKFDLSGAGTRVGIISSDYCPHPGSNSLQVVPGSGDILAAFNRLNGATSWPRGALRRYTSSGTLVWTAGMPTGVDAFFDWMGIALGVPGDTHFLAWAYTDDSTSSGVRYVWFDYATGTPDNSRNFVPDDGAGFYFDSQFVVLAEPIY